MERDRVGGRAAPKSAFDGQRFALGIVAGRVCIAAWGGGRGGRSPRRDSRGSHVGQKRGVGKPAPRQRAPRRAVPRRPRPNLSLWARSLIVARRLGGRTRPTGPQTARRPAMRKLGRRGGGQEGLPSCPPSLFACSPSGVFGPKYRLNMARFGGRPGGGRLEGECAGGAQVFLWPQLGAPHPRPPAQASPRQRPIQACPKSAAPCPLEHARPPRPPATTPHRTPP